MSKVTFKKHIVNKIAEIIKFIFSLAVICFLAIKIPEQASQVVAVAAAFLVGKSLPEKPI